MTPAIPAVCGRKEPQHLATALHSILPFSVRFNDHHSRRAHLLQFLCLLTFLNGLFLSKLKKENLYFHLVVLAAVATSDVDQTYFKKCVAFFYFLYSPPFARDGTFRLLTMLLQLVFRPDVPAGCNGSFNGRTRRRRFPGPRQYNHHGRLRAVCQVCEPNDFYGRARARVAG